MAHSEYPERNATRDERRQRRGRRRTDDRRDESTEDSTVESSSRRKSRPKGKSPWRLQLGLAIILLATLVWFAPAIVANTILRQWFLNRALRDLHGSLTCDSARLGWFSPVGANDLELRDADGKTILRATTCVGDKTLLSLLFSPTSPGHFRIEGGQADLVLRDDGSNLEDVLAGYLQPRETPTARLAVSVELFEARVNLHDTASRRAWLIEPLNCTLKMHTESPDTVSFDVRGTMPPGNAPASTWEAQATLVETETALTLRDAKIKSEAFPLTACQALVRRLHPGTDLAGQLTADLVYRSPGSAPIPTSAASQAQNNAAADKLAAQVEPNLQGHLTIDQISLAGPWLGTDRFQMQQVSLPCRLLWQDNRLNIEQLDLTCDLGKFSCQGSLDNARTLLTDLQPAQALAALANASGLVTGQLDLARLAQLLPDTLKVRNGTEITSGSVNFNIQASPSAAGRTWQGRLETSRLTATDQGRQISWDKPLSVDLAAHTGAQGPVVDRLKCESDFLELTGSGAPQDFHINSTYDLNRLVAQLGQFVDLDGIRLAGGGTINLNWKQSPEGAFTTDTQLQVNNFELTRPGAMSWVEQQLTVTGNATGLMATDAKSSLQSRRIDTAMWTVKSAEDSLSATLTQPVTDASPLTSWPLELKLKGRIARWRSRIEPWFGWPAGWDIDGEADATAAANCSLTVVEIKQSQATFAPLHLWGNGLFVDEPSVRWNGSGHWSAAEHRLDITAATLTAPSLVAQLNNATLSMTNSAALHLAGRVDFQGELAGLQAWTHDPRVASSCRFTGRLQGNAQIDQSAANTAAQVSATIDNLQATPAQGQPWQEPQIKITGKGNYDRAKDTLKLDQLELVSAAVRGDIAGEISRMTATRDMQLAGHVDFDWEKLTRWLQPYVGTHVQLAGHESRSFSLTGPMAPVEGGPANAGNVLVAVPPTGTFAWCQQLSGKADVGWQSANIYGLVFGPTTLKAELSNGVVRLNPLDFPVSNGHLRLSPEVRLSPDPAEISAAPGVILDHIQLTPAMCQQGLKYIAPVLADVTQADGLISMNLEGCRLPLANPSAGDAAGTLTVHAVEIGPGPLLQELSQLLGQLPKAQLAKESAVQYRLVEGRIYHKGLQLDFPGFSIRTYGSVGLDQSLAMMVEMPIPAKWLPNNALRDTLTTRSINLPLIGTLSRPKLDPRAVEQAAGQFLERATEGLFKGEVNQQLDKLFKPLNPLMPR
jgi:translocation and assembly module TamB